MTDRVSNPARSVSEVRTGWSSTGAAFVAGLLIVASGCSPAPGGNAAPGPVGPDGKPGGPPASLVAGTAAGAPGKPLGTHAVPAVVLGDSLSVQATPQYQAKIPGVVVDAVVGRTIVKPNLSDEALSQVPHLVTIDAAWFVVELGTNDSTFAGYPAEQMQHDVDALLDAIGRDRCIAWVLPYAKSPRSPSQIAATNTFRTIAKTTVGKLACNRLLDWGALASADPHILSSDGVHLTPLGMQRLAELVAFGVH